MMSTNGKNRVLPEVTISLEATLCVVCGEKTIECGFVHLCSEACAFNWMSKESVPLSEGEQALADSLSEKIRANLSEALASGKLLTSEVVVEATEKAIEVQLTTPLMAINIKSTVSI